MPPRNSSSSSTGSIREQRKWLPVVIVCLLLPHCLAFPSRFAALHAPNCSAHPTQAYRGHGAPELDTVSSVDLLLAGKKVSTICPGGTYTIQVAFLAPRLGLLTASFGTATCNAVAGAPLGRGCCTDPTGSRWVLTTQHDDRQMSFTVRGFTIPCNAIGSLQFQLTSAFSASSPFYQVTKTFQIGADCASCDPTQPPPAEPAPPAPTQQGTLPPPTPTPAPTPSATNGSSNTSHTTSTTNPQQHQTPPHPDADPTTPHQPNAAAQPGSVAQRGGWLGSRVSANGRLFQNVHGAVMMVVWGLLLPLSMLVGRHKGVVPGGGSRLLCGVPCWLVVQQLLRALCLGLMIGSGGFALIVFRPATALAMAHKVLGIVLVAAVALQLLAGFIQKQPSPKQPTSGSACLLQYMSGMVLVALGGITCVTGIVLLLPASTQAASLLAWLIPALLAGVLLCALDGLLARLADRQHSTLPTVHNPLHMSPADSKAFAEPTT